MKEALRLVVPVPGVVRRTGHDTELLGYRIPAGTYLAIHLWGVHHMADVWPDPERFDPERFAEHRREDKVHRYAFMPFGNGVHKCIGMYFGGMEIKAAMHQLLQRYRLTVAARLPDAGRLDLAPPAPRRPARRAAPSVTVALSAACPQPQSVPVDEPGRTLAGKTLIMSGGSRGIGLAIAVRAARDGANIALIAKTDTADPRLPGTIHTAAARDRGGRRRRAADRRRHPRRGRRSPRPSRGRSSSSAASTSSSTTPRPST